MVSKSKPTKGSTKKGSPPPVAKKSALVPSKGTAKSAKGNAVTSTPSKLAGKAAVKSAVKPSAKPSKSIKSAVPAKSAPKPAPKKAPGKVAEKPSPKSVAPTASSSKPVAKPAEKTNATKPVAKSAVKPTKPSAAAKPAASKKASPAKANAKKATEAKSAKVVKSPSEKAVKAETDTLKAGKAPKPEAVAGAKAKGGKSKQELFSGGFFQEVPVGSPAPRKNKAPQAPVQQVRKPKGEESHDELIARIEKELLTVRMVAKKVQRDQLCTKCCINPVDSGYMVDRDTGYCMECALVLGLGHTREARQQNFHPSLMKSEEEEAAE